MTTTKSQTSGVPVASRPATTEQPTTVAETAALMRETVGTVLIRGGATKLDWAGRVDSPDLIVDTTRLRGVLTHNPADMTASVRAGTTLSELQRHLAADNQWLALDPATADSGATVGGLLAAGDSGPSRLRYGGLRDLVIGVTLVLADGTVAHSGGHVIKNVAGYDLAKLVYGSLGSLALVAEVVVRLHPRPVSTVTVSGSADAAQATAAALALAASPLEPAAIEWISDEDSGGATGQLHVRTNGTPDYVAAAGERVAELLAGFTIAARPLDDNQAVAAWRAQAEAVRCHEDETVLRISGLPTDFGDLVRRARTLAAREGLDLQLASSVALGLHTLRLRGAGPVEQASAVTDLRSEALAQGADVLLRQRPAAVDDHLDVLGPAPSSVELLRAIKAQFDPAGRLAPGRFRPWY